MTEAKTFTAREWRLMELWRRGRVKRDAHGTLRSYFYEGGRFVDAIIVEDV